MCTQKVCKCQNYYESFHISLPHNLKLQRKSLVLLNYWWRMRLYWDYTTYHFDSLKNTTQVNGGLKCNRIHEIRTLSKNEQMLMMRRFRISFSLYCDVKGQWSSGYQLYDFLLLFVWDAHCSSLPLSGDNWWNISVWWEKWRYDSFNRKCFVYFILVLVKTQ